MTSRARVERLERESGAKVYGRFIDTRGKPDASTAELVTFLAGLGIVVGPSDILFHNEDPAHFRTSADEPLSLVGVIEVTQPFEAALAEMERLDAHARD